MGQFKLTHYRGTAGHVARRGRAGAGGYDRNFFALTEPSRTRPAVNPSYNAATVHGELMPPTRVLIAVDFNGDGVPDLVWAER